MKLVSPKTLTASLLGVAFVIYKVKTFDGAVDLFWIIFLGYLTVKGLNVAFSQEAYDEDVRQAYQGKAMYSELFGRFSFIAADIPLMIILLAGLLAVLLPVTTILRIALLSLLLSAVGYALWFSWYISKNKRLRIESGEWGEAVLSEQQERAWKRYDLWHNVCYGILLVLFVLYLIFGDPRIYANNKKLKESLTAISSDSVILEDVVPFEWTTVYTFDPYTSIDRIKKVTGSKSPALKESVSEGMTHFVFMNRGSVAASVCAHPSGLGYSLSFSGGKYTYYDYRDGGYSHIEYGDQTEFDITREDGIVRLYANIGE